MTNDDFQAKYHFSKPLDSRERDIQLKSILNDMVDKNDEIDRYTYAQMAKGYMVDTEDIREITWWQSRGHLTDPTKK